mmetsp:Transcript_14022/g.40365  ORF Transcript_14022/g.40365 Transcript_14022/m.40365 type:complete len:215 (+) Transcript_14022:129-773(+)
MRPTATRIGTGRRSSEPGWPQSWQMPRRRSRPAAARLLSPRIPLLQRPPTPVAATIPHGAAGRGMAGAAATPPRPAWTTMRAGPATLRWMAGAGRAGVTATPRRPMVMSVLAGLATQPQAVGVGKAGAVATPTGLATPTRVLGEAAPLPVTAGATAMPGLPVPPPVTSIAIRPPTGVVGALATPCRPPLVLGISGRRVAAPSRSLAMSFATPPP